MGDTQFSNILNKIMQFNKGVSSGSKTWQDYFGGLKEGEKWKIDFIKNTDLQKASIDDVKKAYDAARTSAINQNTALKAQTLSTKAATAASKAFAVAGNMIAAVAIGEAISFAAKKISEYVNATEIAREKAAGFTQSVSASISDMANNSASIKELNEEYQRLAEGVTATGQNINLSANEYSRYKEIISEISSIMPGLTTYFNDQGEKIGFVKGQLTDVNKEYKQYMQNQANKYLSDGDEEGNDFQDVLDAYNSNNKMGYWENAWNQFKAGWLIADENSLETSKVLKGLEDIYNASQEEVADVLKDGLGSTIANGSYNNEITDEYRMSLIISKMLDTNPREIREMSDEEFAAIQESIKANIDMLKSRIEADMSSVRAGLINIAYSSDDFWNVDDNEIRNGITTFISSLTSDMWDELDVETVNDTRVFVNKIISAMSENKEGFSDAWEQLFRLEPDKLSVDEYVAKVKEFISKLCSAIGIDDSEIQEKFAISLGFNIDEVQVSENALKGKIGDFNDEVKSKVIQSFSSIELKEVVDSDMVDWSNLVPNDFKGTSDEIADVIVKNIRASLNEKSSDVTFLSFSKAWKSLTNTTDDNLKNTVSGLLELANAGMLTPKTLESVEGYNTLLKQIGLTASEAVEEIYKLKDVDYISMIASMREGVSSISGILRTKEENLSDNGTAKNGIGADAFVGMPDELKKCKKAYKQFVNVLGDGSSSMDECQKAANKLATEYVNSNYFLEKLNDSNEAAVVSMLKEMGVANADYVVTEALARKKAEAWVVTQDFTDKTGEEIIGLINEQGALIGTTKALEYYTLSKLWNNGNALDTKEDLNNLIAFVEGLGLGAEALQAYAEAKYKANNVLAPGNDDISKFLSGDMSAEDLVKKGQQDSKELKEKEPEYNKLKINAANEISDIIAKMQNIAVSVSPDAGSGYGNAGNIGAGKGSSNVVKETKVEIDWLARAIDVTSGKIDLFKAKLENLFKIKAKSTNLNKQIRQATKLINAYKKAEKKYKAKADSINLSDDLKKLVHNGKIRGSYKELIKEYGEKTADKIEKYQDYYDKYQDAKKSKYEAKTQKHELNSQKYQLYVDEAESQLDKINARADNEYGSDKNKYLKNSEKWIKQSYNYQIKQAVKIEKDPVKAAQLKAEKEAAIRENKIARYQNMKDEYDDSASYYQAKAESEKDAGKKQKYLEKQAEYIEKSYNQQKKIAKEEKNSNLAKQLEIEKQNELLDIRVQILQNYADEYEASANLAVQYAGIAVSANEKNRFESENINNIKKQYEYLIAIAKEQKDLTEAKRLEAELSEKITESAKVQFDNIVNEYGHIINELDARVTSLNTRISLAEAQGKTVNASFYKELAVQEDINISNLTEKYNSLYRDFNTKVLNSEIAKGSDEWYEMRDTIMDAKQAMDDAVVSQEEFNKQAREADRQIKEHARNMLSELNDEVDFYQQILGYREMFESDTGAITEAGNATIALSADKMSNSIVLATQLKKDIAALDSQFRNGKMGYEEYTEQRVELLSQQRDAQLAYYDECNAIKDLIDEGYNAQLEAMTDIVNKYKETLQAEKSLHDYQNNIADQTKNIASLKKQIAALQGNVSEEARAKLQKLNVQLEEAQKELEETEYEKYISDQEEILDAMLNEYESFIDAQLKCTDDIIEKVVDAAHDTAGETNGLLREIAGQWGTNISDILDNITRVGDYSTITDKISEAASLIVNAYNQDIENSSKDAEDVKDIITVTEISNQDTKADEVFGFNTSDKDWRGGVIKRLEASDSLRGDLIQSANRVFLGDTKVFTSQRLNEIQEPAFLNNKLQSVNVGDVNIHLDGSGIVDERSFVDTFQSSQRLRDCIGTYIGDAVVGRSKLSYKKF